MPIKRAAHDDDDDMQEVMVMDHAKMTFAEAAKFGRVSSTVIHQVTAISGIFNRVGTAGHSIELMGPIVRLLLSSQRKNAATLSATQRKAFNTALSAAIADGSYQATADIHAANHMMHGSMGTRGMLRFLAWHRAYLYRMEQVLQSHVPGVTIPYWDWAHNPTLPSWLLLPAGVTRGPDTSRTPPTQSDIDTNVLPVADYVTFTHNLEGYHNTMHMYAGGNKMPYPAVSPQDPLFWLHHANIDRIWDQWQKAHPGIDPPITGPDAVMDPWTLTVADLRDTYDLWYYYV